MIWAHDIDKFYFFTCNANNTHTNITFTYEASTALPFLNVLIKINNTICTRAYSRPTDRHCYLHFKGSHPIHLRHSIISHKFPLYKRICSDHSIFFKCSKQLTHRFLIKVYPITIINKQWQKVVNIQRVNLLRYKEVKPTGRLPIIHTYHPSVERVYKTIIDELKNYSKLALSKHPLDVTPICAQKQPQN